MQTKMFLRALALLTCLHAPAIFAAESCEAEASWKASDGERHFVVLAGRTDVFYERSGPTFVMLIRSAGDTVDLGAFGIHADANGHPAFGAVPASEYETFLGEPAAQGLAKSSAVMLRLEISGPQYERVLRVLRTWERRVAERALLYPDFALDNILLVRQTTDELNRCRQALVPYALDWGLDDDISEHNIALRIPFEYFKELKALNVARHVSDASMPVHLQMATLTAQRGPQAPAKEDE
ncbi:MAG TPA: hypothetical protein VFU13_15130 [Steroidobacteraceae bacterium]|nr:hypothetical protein [Steroidobacteraceae bacterium]